MSLADVKYLPETPAHDPEIEAINDEAFGPGRFVLGAYKIREGGPHERTLSFVAVDGDIVVASVRMTRIAAGAGRAVMNGALAMGAARKKIGHGPPPLCVGRET
ncbi:N-acetyltransferase, partial [Mesorhizobium sp. M0907]|uniref:GNAT family N-acetyltransferase n=1 Tax=Mesorhizobium sp. M0907 TaxID=2957023 RepID=UPI00333542F2